MNAATELCLFPTIDGERLAGLLLQPDVPPRPDLAVVAIHGVALNFYTGPQALLGQALAARGWTTLLMNTRGHDWVSRAGNLTAFGGAAYENLEDCLPDLDGALAWLGTRGYRRFVLLGHSLGAIKALYYQGTRERADVAAVVSCSAPRQYYRARAEEQLDFEARMAEAEALVAAGRGEEFLWAETTGSPGLFSARTYVSKYGRHERNDVRPHAQRLDCPLLVTAGGAEWRFFPELARELATLAPRATCVIVEGADHFYHRHEGELIETVAGWLEENVAGTPNPSPRGRGE